ncbi:hypothetical protein E8E13_005433 [Curvularia kusanoi]|uniref:BZIP domain-containing protein n=1 Tax=Curvularia kusanoi TaxID=90978 RepID=A0A9P4W7X1_CURKU|nr:hypothetical protein E8E13_005433 [Curvularia kusanoi]
MMQIRGMKQRDLDMDFTAPSEDATMYGISNWASSPQEDHSYLSTPDYAAFPRQSDHAFASRQNFKKSGTSHNNVYGRSNGDPLLSDLSTQFSPNTAHGPAPVAGYPEPAYFTPSNVHTSSYDPETISPLNTGFPIDQISPNSKLSYNDNLSAFDSSPLATFAHDSDSALLKRRRDSQQAFLESHSSADTQAKTGRRRGSEYAEPGSARAIYLEKNRKAASKCRSKQKRQQDDLVEAARNAERKNKILKAEVEMLRSGVRDLMGLVGEHTGCPDTRLQLYVQREADRLAAGSQRGSLSNPDSRRSFSVASSAEKTSSPAEG